MGQCGINTQRLTFDIYQAQCAKWNVTNNVHESYQCLIKDKIHINPLSLDVEDRMYLFLYAKQIIDMENKPVRRAQLQQIFGKKKQPKNIRSGSWDRLRRIVDIGETSTNHVNAFDVFCSQHPEWASSDSWVLFRDHDALKHKKNVYVERTQLSGLCYMHAPIVFQHYLVAMSTESDNVGMIDIADYLRQHMDKATLRGHIFENNGGSSSEFIRIILGFETHEVFMRPDVKAPDVPDHLRNFGPGLISSMEIYSSFPNEHIFQFTGSPRGLNMKLGHHAMVLIGYRYTQSHELMYLLQNWWNHKPFVEVNADYLRACGAILTFCTQPQHVIPKTFAVNLNRHVECAHDTMEMLPLEFVH